MALIEVMQTGDGETLAADQYRGLIEMLSSDDPAMRMLAIRALERLTDETLEFDYSAPEYVRERGVRAWGEWYAARFGSESSLGPDSRSAAAEEWSLQD